jgi:hypothetical protein
MSIKSRLFIGALAAAIFACLSSANMVEAQIVSRSKEIVVVKPASLPELAQQGGIALQMYSESGDGSSYLYIEQNHGERLLALNVTDPAHVKMVGAVTLAVPGPFEFLGALGDSAFLVRFRNNAGLAVLDLRKPKVPALKPLSALQNPGRIESLGHSAFLMVSEGQLDVPPIPRDYQVVDTSNPFDPTLLFIVKQVNASISRDETGTIFLLGSEGLTIVRRPRVEEEYRSEQSYTN